MFIVNIITNHFYYFCLLKESLFCYFVNILFTIQIENYYFDY